MSQLFFTADGSPSLISDTFSESYHSNFGALCEAITVYIQPALDHLNHRIKGDTLRVFEMGFGTGLNAFLCLLNCRDTSKTLIYDGIDAFPLDRASIRAVLTPHAHDDNALLCMNALIEGAWDQSLLIHERCLLRKITGSLLDYSFEKSQYDVIFFDAFSPNVQAELWTESVFKILYDALDNPGFLSTYCVKGSVKRALKAAGFRIEKHPGPPGKREILYAYKDA